MNSQALLTNPLYKGGMDALNFGEWLEDQYQARGWTQKFFASQMGVANTAVSNWVNGRQLPEAENCDRIAAALGIDRNEVRRRAGRREVTIIAKADAEQGQWGTASANLRKGLVGQSTEHPLTEGQGLTDDTVTQFLSRIESEVQAIAAGMRRAGLLPGPPLELGDEVALPVIGRVPADSLRWTAVEDELSVDVTRAEVGHARAPFGLIASGDCFRWIGIWSGDVVICDRALGREPKDRQIVVVRVNNEVTLKRWCVTGNGVELRDGDEQVVYRVQPEDDVEIIGFYLTYKPVAER